MGVLVTQSAKIVCRVGTWSYGFWIQDTKVDESVQVTHPLSILHKLCRLHSRLNRLHYTYVSPHFFSVWVSSNPFEFADPAPKPRWPIKQGNGIFGDRRFKMSIWHFGIEFETFQLKNSPCERSPKYKLCALRFGYLCFATWKNKYIHRACDPRRKVVAWLRGIGFKYLTEKLAL